MKSFGNENEESTKAHNMDKIHKLVFELMFAYAEQQKKTS